MTERQQALAAYFYRVCQDPRIRAAGQNPTKFKDAFFACVAEDVPAVMKLALGGLVDRYAEPAKNVARFAVENALRGEVPDRTAAAIGGTVEAMVVDAVGALGRAISGQGTKQADKRSRR